MSTKDAYKQKIEAELELAQAQLAVFKARGNNLTADARLRHARQVDELKQKADATKEKLKELGEASEATWEQLKDGVEHMWGTLQSALKDTVTKFKD